MVSCSLSPSLNTAAQTKAEATTLRIGAPLYGRGREVHAWHTPPGVVHRHSLVKRNRPAETPAVFLYTIGPQLHGAHVMELADVERDACGILHDACRAGLSILTP